MIRPAQTSADPLHTQRLAGIAQGRAQVIVRPKTMSLPPPDQRSPNIPHPGSFRDRDGFVFSRSGKVLRQVNAQYSATYDRAVAAGLYNRLWSQGLLIKHQELSETTPPGAHKILLPEQLSALLYPYEWCFGQLKDAALVTLRIQREAMKLGFSLKDASAYNIQFLNGRPTLIDTLSFEPYTEGAPWAAYRQFCQHFLAPLVLMARVDPRLSLLLRNHIDGIPLDLAARILPACSRFNLGLLVHLHLHARAQRRYVNRDIKVTTAKVSRQGLEGILNHLQKTVENVRWAPGGTEWGEYYTITNYSDTAREDKRSVVDRWIGGLRPQHVWDMGANDGTYSRLASERGIPTIAWDIDPSAVELAYRWVKRQQTCCLLPALVDLTNPSPSIGWSLEERGSIFDRPKPDLLLALALIHHLAIGNNVPLERCAAFFAKLAPNLIIEWVPKSDSKVRELLQNRSDIFEDYSTERFEAAFGRHFEINERCALRASERILFRMTVRNQ